MIRLVRSSVALLGAAALVLTIPAGGASADTVVVVGSRTGQSATVDCAFNAQTNTQVFTVSNTSTTAVVTGIGFDLVPSDFTGRKSAGLDGFTGNQASSTTSTFVFRDDALGAVPRLRSVVLDYGFTTGRSFRSGAEAAGVDPGDAASFVVTGSAFAGMTEGQICSAAFVRFQ